MLLLATAGVARGQNMVHPDSLVAYLHPHYFLGNASALAWDQNHEPSVVSIYIAADSVIVTFRTTKRMSFSSLPCYGNGGNVVRQCTWYVPYIWREIYGVSQGVLELRRREEGTIIPRRVIEERIEWK